MSSDCRLNLYLQYRLIQINDDNLNKKHSDMRLNIYNI